MRVQASEGSWGLSFSISSRLKSHTTLQGKSVNLTKQILNVKASDQTKVSRFLELWSEIQYFKSTQISVDA